MLWLVNPLLDDFDKIYIFKLGIYIYLKYLYQITILQDTILIENVIIE